MKLSKYIIGILISGLFVINAQSQCYENRHSTNWYDGWTSCEKAPNPNPDRAASHWIMYDLGAEYQLERSYIWNYNDLNNLDFGIQEVIVDYSLDGSNWIESGIYTIPQASGITTYPGAEGPNLGGIEARYLLLTALSNYGGTCFALGEIKIEAEPINVAVDDLETRSSSLRIDVFPNPIKSESRIYVESAQSGVISFQLTNLLGQTIEQGDITDQILQFGYFNLNVTRLNAGEYILVVQNEKEQARKSLIKI